MLIIAEYTDGRYEPLGQAINEEEADEIYSSYRVLIYKQEVERPKAVKLWERRARGGFEIVGELRP